MKILSIIIPFSLSKERPYIQERVLQKIKEFEAFKEEIDFIFVEGYSSVFIDLKKRLKIWDTFTSRMLFSKMKDFFL